MMLGQEVTPVKRLVPTRMPTDAELSKWNEALQLVQDLSDMVYANGLTMTNLALMHKFAVSRGSETPAPAKLEADLIDLENKLANVQRAMRGVQDKRYGIQLVDGDINIVAPKGSDNLGGFFVAVGIGIGVSIVVAGLTAWLMDKDKEVRYWRPRAKAMEKVLDDDFRSRGPEAFAEWVSFKESEGIIERKEVSDGIFSSIGKTLKKGLGWGVGLAVVILAVGFLWKRR